MENIINAIKSIISPEQSWSAFVMKITSLLIVSVIVVVALVDSVAAVVGEVAFLVVVVALVVIVSVEHSITYIYNI